jgi:hypothetical protein
MRWLVDDRGALSSYTHGGILDVGPYRPARNDIHLSKGLTEMKINEGSIDRVIRGIVGAILLVVGLVLVKGPVGIVLGVLGVILIVTGIIGFCPLYTIFHINTAKKA